MYKKGGANKPTVWAEVVLKISKKRVYFRAYGLAQPMGLWGHVVLCICRLLAHRPFGPLFMWARAGPGHMGHIDSYRLTGLATIQIFTPSMGKIYGKKPYPSILPPPSRRASGRQKRSGNKYADEKRTYSTMIGRKWQSNKCSVCGKSDYKRSSCKDALRKSQKRFIFEQDIQKSLYYVGYF